MPCIITSNKPKPPAPKVSADIKYPRIRIDQEQYQEIVAVATETRRDFKEVTTMLLRYALDNLVIDEEEQAEPGDAGKTAESFICPLLRKMRMEES